ncbi:hypothetical protein L1887_55533 [Cichorium endivia]|nr:hypothetical protein L1887_55533 [Cichorium endivia]
MRELRSTRRRPEHVPPDRRYEVLQGQLHGSLPASAELEEYEVAERPMRDVQYGDIDIDQWRGGLIQQHVTAPTAIQEDNMSNAYKTPRAGEASAILTGLEPVGSQSSQRSARGVAAVGDRWRMLIIKANQYKIIL